ncbi:DUF2268 domain-containing putative Zn-dependent protease [Deinococcus soli (ex Cha et al. 2016)]|uniref:DUF2268 domain-containing protein n=1 Tax=Deinococcus soli (ex Cha et al. 2016) TaxID=1309411 RepID=A0A0F7JMG1_9DEIO|nr:DUF2268 domain-containing putative Zn-dependent protease [Deinococcus soli (ex Cha et al. 2016)]AKH15850.1 hypothetical protein SY84_00975 [Deinococcus soli (ex Cha et al. 2016)]
MRPHPRPNLFHLLNAGGQLPPDLAAHVDEVGRSAFLRLADRLELDGVDAVLYASPWTIPETGLVGNAPDGHSVHIALTPTSPHFRAGWRQELPATLAHELHHARRWRHAGLGTLLDALVFEGLALHFESEERGEVPQYAHPTTELDGLWARASAHLDGPYDYHAWFMGSAAQDLPRWGGYALGLELVRRFLNGAGGDAVTHAATASEDLRHAWPPA